MGFMNTSTCPLTPWLIDSTLIFHRLVVSLEGGGGPGGLGFPAAPAEYCVPIALAALEAPGVAELKAAPGMMTTPECPYVADLAVQGVVGLLALSRVMLSLGVQGVA